MEKAEILEMTVAYVSQLHSTRCRSPLNDVVTATPSRKLHTEDRDSLQELQDSSSSEYRAGFSECFFHVQRFLAEQAATTSAEMSSDHIGLSQLLVNHLSQLVGDDRRPTDNERLVRSSPPSPDTTLSAIPSSDLPLPPLPSKSPAIRIRHSLSRSSALSAEHSSTSLGRHAFPSFLLPVSGAMRRDQPSGDGAVMVEQPSSSDYEAQHRLRNTVLLVPPPTIQPSSTASISLSISSISMSVSSDRSSSQRDYAVPTSPGNADHGVWRPWRPEANTRFHCLL